MTEDDEKKLQMVMKMLEKPEELNKLIQNVDKMPKNTQPMMGRFGV